MSTTESAAALITYMSNRFLKVAELNSALDQFGSELPLPESGNSIRFLTANLPDWSAREYRTYIFGRNAWNLGGFDFGEEPVPLAVRELSVADREALEAWL